MVHSKEVGLGMIYSKEVGPGRGALRSCGYLPTPFS